LRLKEFTISVAGGLPLRVFAETPMAALVLFAASFGAPLYFVPGQLVISWDNGRYIYCE